MGVVVAVTLATLSLQLSAVNDRVVASGFPVAMLSPGWAAMNAAGEPYYYRASGKPDRIILFLHSWSGDYTQVAAFPEFAALNDAVIVSPNFNGPNLSTNPNVANTCASDDALARIRLVLSEVQYKTGLKRVYLVGASGGGMAGLAFLGKYPGIVHRASIWVPIFDMAQWYFEADQNFKTDMVACFGRAPVDSWDSLYRSRSPVERLVDFSGPLHVFINAASNDATVPVHHSRNARDMLMQCPDCTVEYIETAMGHTFNAQTALQQILIE